jgi:exodeoxyribonuclease VIII
VIDLHLPFPAYLSLHAAHFSAIKEIDVGPEHYAHALANEREETDALRAGRAVHSLILTPDAGDVVIWTGKARRGKAWDEFAEEHAGRTILTDAEATMAEGMRASVAAHPAASALLSGGDAEVTLTWDDPRVGPCKARVDYLHRRPIAVGGERVHMVELKTTRARGRNAIMREIAARLYYAQTAFYIDGLAANGFACVDARIVVVEKTPPYAVHVFRVGDGPLESGRRKVDAWLTKIAECTRAGVWRGEDEADLVLPAYVDGDGLEDVDMGGIVSEEV